MGATMIWYPIMQYRNGHLTKGVCWLHLLWHDNIPQGPIFDNSGFCVDGTDLISPVDLNGGCQVACLVATKWTSCIQRIRGMMPPWRCGQCDKSLALNIFYEWRACCENDVKPWSANSSQQSWYFNSSKLYCKPRIRIKHFAELGQFCACAQCMVQVIWGNWL